MRATPAPGWPRGVHSVGALLLLSHYVSVGATSPVGTVTANATQSMVWGSPVQLSYMEAVNCTLEFDQEVVGFNESALAATNNTNITNFVAVSASVYTFQISADTNANVSVWIPPGGVRNTAGTFNSEVTAFISVMYYAYPPSASLRLDGFAGQRTDRTANLAYIVFNSTTEYNGTAHFSSSLVLLSPFMEISNFQKVDDKLYKFNFEIPMTDNTSAAQCVSPDAVLPGVNYSKFLCSQCPRSERCMTNATYPPSGTEYMFLEFPLEVVLQAVPALGMEATSLPFFFDTLWAEVTLEAPAYAREPFFVTISWSEAMSDLTAAQPVFGLEGPSVDQQALQQNLTILSPSSFKVLVVPAGTGILTISINGTRGTSDLAGNANDFRTNSNSRTGSQVVVVYSAGPPLQGALSFQYQRPPALFEYGVTVTSVWGVPSLTASWSDFVTATRYDFWVSWGKNMTTPVAVNLTTTTFHFHEFHALLGLEYTAHVRAYNIWGESTVVTKVFLQPKVDVIADGSYRLVTLPSFMSQQQTNVTFRALIGSQTFLSLNPLKVLSFRSIDRQAGDVEPCSANSQLLRCTFVNFHIEVPSASFVVFRHPIRLQFTFGRKGWADLYFRPQLRYWEAFHEEWRNAADSCPPHQRYEKWNDLHRIYSVSICHLTQFSVFEYFSPPAATTTQPPPPRPESYEDPTFLAGLGSGTVGLLICCGVCFFVCKRPWQSDERARVPFKELGIRPMTDRLPSRRSADGLQHPVGRAGPHDDELLPELLPALPAPPSLPQALEDTPMAAPGV